MWVAIAGVIGFLVGYGLRIMVVDIRASRRPQRVADYRIDTTYKPTIGDQLEAKRPGLPSKLREKVQG